MVRQSVILLVTLMLSDLTTVVYNVFMGERKGYLHCTMIVHPCHHSTSMHTSVVHVHTEYILLHSSSVHTLQGVGILGVRVAEQVTPLHVQNLHKQAF